ncbi:hypothetical protein [Dongia sp.]|uniref:hypothetical protein n=1 Tax=Dongia sp. TaxID=1977262 RepID=UPI0035B394B6
MSRKAVVPTEFEDLLTPAGRKVLGGRSDLCGFLANPRQRFLAADGFVVKSRAEGIRRVLEADLRDLLTPMSDPIPPETIWEMKHDYEEWLPKTVRVSTAYLEKKKEKAYLRAAELGLVDLLKSESLAAFAEKIAGQRLDRKSGQQILCYGPGDYAGPHNDHHPENSRAAKGYVDVHLSLASKEVDHQYLVYAKAGHFTEMVQVSGLGFLTIYRLPFWHYTTPLQAKPGKVASARRWVLLATYLYGK